MNGRYTKFKTGSVLEVVRPDAIIAATLLNRLNAIDTFGLGSRWFVCEAHQTLDPAVWDLRLIAYDLVEWYLRVQNNPNQIDISAICGSAKAKGSVVHVLTNDNAFRAV